MVNPYLLNQCYKEDDSLNKERKKWREKSLESLQEAVLARKEMIQHVEPFLQESISATIDHPIQGKFDGDIDGDDESDDTPFDYRVQQEMQKEFSDSIGLLVDLQQKLPQQLASYDEIEKLIDQIEKD
ncbi:hypothetical protein BC941DRAFT_436423 [Chlamydoabsidia padenii]|nr:hypothetical protein BC941DRAFT_436423 [Chlamydoabsidia padenii]